MGFSAVRTWFLFLSVLFVTGCQNPFYREAATQGVTIQLNILPSSRSTGRMIVAAADTVKLDLFQKGSDNPALETYEKVLSSGEMTLSHTFHGLIYNTEYLIKAQVFAQEVLIHEGETSLVLRGDDEPVVLTLLPAKTYLLINGIIPEKTLQTLNMSPGSYKAFELTYNTPGTYEILVDGTVPVNSAWDVILQYPGGNYEKTSEFTAVATDLLPGKLTFWIGNSSTGSKSPSVFWGKKEPLDPTGHILTSQPDPLFPALLSWTPPSDPDLDHYEIILTGPSTPVVPNISANGAVTVALNLLDGDYDVSVTSVDKDGLKSPGAPVKLSFTAYFPVTAVTLDSNSLSLVTGDSTNLTATVLPAYATNKLVTWTSSAPTIATVGVTGLVTAVAPGTAVITVTTQDGNKAATCTLTVTPLVIPVTGVTLNNTVLNLTTGATANLVETVSPTNATNKLVTWTSSAPTIATVGVTGLVTAVAPGTAVITVTTQDGNKAATCTLTVAAPPPGLLGITLTLTNPTVPVVSFTDGAGNPVLAEVTQGATVTVQAVGQTVVDWWIDGISLGNSTNPLDIATGSMSLGNHSLTCIYSDGTNQYSENFSFTVLGAP